MSRPSLILYSRPNCHLCDEMLAAAAPILARHGRTIETVNIDTDPALKTRYGLDIPVLALGDREICRHRLDEEALERALKD